jgi:CelD/BcsL family acetyltransferase involved in cellulose biosynthesis
VRVVVDPDLSRFTQYWPRTTTKTLARRYVFQCADVVEVWCDTLGQAQNVEPWFVAVLSPAEEPLLLLPLGIQRRKWGRKLVFLDAGVSDYNAPVLFAGARDWDEATMRSTWRHIKACLPAFDLAVLEKMPEFVEDWPNPLRFLSTGRSAAQGHGITVPSEWDGAARTVLPNLPDSRRRERKLAKLGTLAIEVAGTRERASSLLDAMLAMKSRKSVETLGVDLFRDKPGYADYYLEATRRLFAGGSVHVSALTLDGQALAAHWGYVLGDRFYQLMPAFRNEDPWRSFAPGRLLNEFLIGWSASRGLKIFDFGHGDEPYKSNYCDLEWPLWDAVLPATPIGRAWAWGLAGRRFARA